MSELLSVFNHLPTRANKEAETKIKSDIADAITNNLKSVSFTIESEDGQEQGNIKDFQYALNNASFTDSEIIKLQKQLQNKNVTLVLDSDYIIIAKW
jgi:hypothetical protein